MKTHHDDLNTPFIIEPYHQEITPLLQANNKKKAEKFHPTRVAAYAHMK